MLVDFLFDLRAEGMKVGATELLWVAKALVFGLHDDSLEGFYDVSRALFVHREADLDAFDRAFKKRFEGVELASLRLVDELDAWLKNPIPMRALTDEERALLKSLDVDELRKMLEERLKEQKERHDGGNKWIGTGGTSPFGHGGFHPSGVRIGGSGGGRSAVAVAGERRFRAYRSDVVLDVRTLEVALRKLRAFHREGAEDELDLEATIDHTARQAGELEVVLRPPRRPNVKVLLLMDVGGSMDPHAQLVSRMFSAAKRASNLKLVEPWYFHNAIYGKVWRDAAMREPKKITEIVAEHDRTWKLVVVGDALMHPSELLGAGWDRELEASGFADVTAVGWFMMLARHFERSAWLNPEPSRYWSGTAELIARIFSMCELTLDGLGEAVRHLSRRGAP